MTSARTFTENEAATPGQKRLVQLVRCANRQMHDLCARFTDEHGIGPITINGLVGALTKTLADQMAIQCIGGNATDHERAEMLAAVQEALIANFDSAWSAAAISFATYQSANATKQ